MNSGRVLEYRFGRVRTSESGAVGQEARLVQIVKQREKARALLEGG